MVKHGNSCTQNRLLMYHLSATESSFEHHARSLATVVAKGNVVATHEHAALLITSAQQFIAVAQKEVESTADPAYRAELEGKIAVIQSGEYISFTIS